MRDQSQISFNRIIILWAGLFSITCQNKAIVLYSDFSNIFRTFYYKATRSLPYRIEWMRLDSSKDRNTVVWGVTILERNHAKFGLQFQGVHCEAVSEIISFLWMAVIFSFALFIVGYFYYTLNLFLMCSIQFLQRIVIFGLLSIDFLTFFSSIP